MTMLSIDQLNNIYIQNKDFYDKMSKDITHNITGRICHHSVLILNILVSYLNIKTYLEIGVHSGTSMSYVVRQNKHIDCYGIDLFSKTFAWYTKDKLSIEQTKNNIENNNLSQSSINLIQGNSHDHTTHDQVKNIFQDQNLDLLFIDADHSYNAVRRDFELYSPLVKSGGLIVMDDYNKKWPGVIKFCNSVDLNTYTNIGLFLNNELIFQKI